MIRILIAISLYFSSIATAQSSTFIGNGGDTLTLKVNTALLSLRETLEQWPNYDADIICTCQADLDVSKDLNHSHYCSALQQLSKEKLAFCQQFLSTHRYALLDLTTPGKVKFTWQEEALFVEDSDQEKKQVQALANRDTKTITFYKKDIEKLSQVDLLALLTHELTHLVRLDKHNKYIDDNMQIGPFNRPEGGRALLDTLGAAIVTIRQEHLPDANTEETQGENQEDYEEHIETPPDYRGKNMFLGLGSNARTFNVNGFRSADLSPLLLHGTLHGTRLSFSYYPTLWGIAINHSDLYLANDWRSLVNVEYNISETDVQLLYRWFPLKDSGTRFSNGFFTFGLGAFNSYHRHQISDDFVEISGSDNLANGILSMQYKFPLLHWLWLTVYTDLSIQEVQFKQLNYKHEFFMNSVVIGVDYGF